MATAAIYCLIWAKPRVVYVGGTTNYDRRTARHRRMLKINKHRNTKVRAMGREYGMPEIRVVEVIDQTPSETLLERLTTRESWWIGDAIRAYGKERVLNVNPVRIGDFSGAQAARAGTAGTGRQPGVI